MSKELIISTQDDEVKIAMLEEGRLLELHEEAINKDFVVGDLYLGKVKKLAPSLNAVFVDIGYSKDAFLHYHDLGPHLRSFMTYAKIVGNGKFKSHYLKTFRKEEQISKDGDITDILNSGDTILVQISKEPINTKGPRISSEISIAGRFLVLTPFSDRVSISQKIKSKTERDRLTTLVESIKPEGFGVIIRTVAERKKVAELHADLNYLINKWSQVFKNLQKKKAPSKILSEVDLASSILRDTFNDDFTKISVDDADLAEEMQEYLKIIAPEKQNIVKEYNDIHLPIFEKFGVEKQIKHAFGMNVTIPQSKGAYLVIEHTEALHVIDVNSGNISRSSKSQEESAFAINKIAATEVARQLRLRDMGGIVVVDFIDMSESGNKKLLYEHLKEEMSKEKARHKVLPPSKFGLIQITRQRVRPELIYKTKEENPNKKGSEVESSILLIDKIDQVLSNVLERKNKKNLQKIFLHVHPFVAAYLKQGFPSVQHRWFLKHKKWIKITPRDSYKYLQFNFLDIKNNTLYNESN